MTLAVIGAVIGEFVGSVNGLGNLLLSANSQLDSPLAWAALVWLSVLGILLFAAVAVAERIVMPWGDVRSTERPPAIDRFLTKRVMTQQCLMVL